MRPSRRAPDQLRTCELIPGFSPHAEGSCLIKMGGTHVICNASVDERVPPFLRNTGKGWVTAEYGMLPRATNERVDREAARGKQTGRTQEIQRLIGRALRSVVDFTLLGERQVKIDCDVIQADGGTRTASITGGYVALYLACQKLVEARKCSTFPLTDFVSAISCGLYQETPILDLDYPEDQHAQVDANFVLTGSGKLIEIQATAEESPFEESSFMAMMALAKKGCATLYELQKDILVATPLKQKLSTL